MHNPDHVLLVYRELATLCDRQGQAQMRDRYWVLAADAAWTAGRADEAEQLRLLLLQHTPQHLLQRYPTFAVAVTAAEVQGHIASLRNSHPFAEAEQLLRLLRKGAGEPEYHGEPPEAATELILDLESSGIACPTKGPGRTSTLPPAETPGPSPDSDLSLPPLVPPPGEPTLPSPEHSVLASFSTGDRFPRPFGRYTILGEIGRGGMGIVYRGRHLQLHRAVAIKVLPGALFTDPHMVERLLREARVGAQLQHPNICQVLDAGQEGGEFYIAMELLEGRTLRSLLHQRGRLPVTEACRYARQLFDALHYLAGQEVVHRDIKPGNLMIGAGERLKLMDLGLVKDTDPGESQLTTTGVVMGTPAYMSPEQINDASKATWRSDLYAAGVTLFEMLTGRTPFQHESPALLMLEVLHHAVPDPRTLRPDLPEPLAQLLVRLLDKDPDRRPPHREVMDVLDAFGKDAPTVLLSGSSEEDFLVSAAVASVVGRIREAAAQFKDPDRDDLLDWLPREEGQPRLGHYYLEERIGPRAAISTYRARHFLTGVPHIVRVLPPAFSQMAPERLRALLQQRGQLVQITMHCRHLARLVDVGTTRLVQGNFKALYYTVEDFLPGTSLEQRIESRDVLPKSEARRCLVHALRGLQALHARQLLHGNLHAGKLFLDDGESLLRIADLSLACEARGSRDGSEGKRSVLNQVDWLGNRSPRRRQYIAPEVLCEGEDATPLSEQYALGVVFIEAMTGRFIRTDPNDLKLIKYVHEDLEDRLRDLEQTAGRMTRVLRRMVSTNARSRFPDLGEVQKALSRKPRAPEPVPPPPPVPSFDVFVSYRRESGAETARAIVARLQAHELDCFLDVDALPSGHFDERLLAIIANTPHFVVILSEGCLDRCREPSDWLRREIAHALRSGRNVVPVLLPRFRMPDAAELPRDLRALARCNGPSYSHEYFDEFIKKLVKFLNRG